MSYTPPTRVTTTDQRFVTLNDIWSETPPVTVRVRFLAGTNDDGILMEVGRSRIVIENVRGLLNIHIWDGNEALDGDPQTVTVENVRI